MRALPKEIVDLMTPFAPVFTKSTWKKVQEMWCGAILTPGKRTVTSVLQVLGRVDRGDYSKYHQVLNRVRNPAKTSIDSEQSGRVEVTASRRWDCVGSRSSGSATYRGRAVDGRCRSSPRSCRAPLSHRSTNRPTWYAVAGGGER